MTASALRGCFVWHELLTTDTAAGLGFYTKVTSWKTQPYGDVPGYTLLLGSRGPVGGVMRVPDPSIPPNWLSYIGTSDVEATASQATTLGGKVITPPTQIPVGRFAILSDPQGAVFAIYTPNLLDEKDPKAQLGEFSWHELVTTDLDAAWRFYQQLFGWEKGRAMDMGAPVGVYQIFGMGGLDMGGIYRKPPDYPAPPNWLPYILVSDTRKAASLTPNLGGQIMMGPMEVPGGDLIAMGMDPQGAAFAVHSLAVAVKAEKAGRAGKAGAKKAAAKKPAMKKAAAGKAGKAGAKKASAKKPATKKAAPKRKAAPRKAAKKAGKKRR